MAKNKVITHLVCQACRERNYSQKVTRKRTAGSLELKKYCSRCRQHNSHKETK